MMADTPLEAQRVEMVARLKSIRQGYEARLADVGPDVAYRGSEWSIADLLGHVVGGFYRTMARRLLEEDHPAFGGGAYDPEAAWQRNVDRVMGSIDDALGIAEGLTAEQMVRSGTYRGREHTPLDALDQWAEHFEEHLTQLADEVRPREGLK